MGMGLRIYFHRSQLVSNLQTPTLYKCAAGVWRFETIDLNPTYVVAKFELAAGDLWKKLDRVKDCEIV